MPAPAHASDTLFLEAIKAVADARVREVEVREDARVRATDSTNQMLISLFQHSALRTPATHKLVVEAVRIVEDARVREVKATEDARVRAIESTNQMLISLFQHSALRTPVSEVDLVSIVPVREDNICADDIPAPHTAALFLEAIRILGETRVREVKARAEERTASDAAWAPSHLQSVPYRSLISQILCHTRTYFSH